MMRGTVSGWFYPAIMIVLAFIIGEMQGGAGEFDILQNVT
jgi:hypothetical protein